MTANKTLLVFLAAAFVTSAAIAQEQAPPVTQGEAAAEEAPITPPTREEKIDLLLERLADPEIPNGEKVAEELRRLWSQSGSATADLLLRRGQKAMKEEKLTRAIHHFTALVEIAPDFAEGWNARATAFYTRGDWGMSLADIEQALRLNPNHFGALSGLGFILEQTDQPKKALAAFEAALAINPHMERIREGVERLSPDVKGRDL